MSSITAVIFDVYETLVHHDQSVWLPTFDDICRDQGLPLDGQELWARWRPLEMEFRKTRNQRPDPFKSYEQAWRECFEAIFRELGKGDAAAPARRMVQEMGQRVAYPETRGVVVRLRETGRFRVGVLSNADDDFLTPLLDGLGLAFDGVVSSESARAYKPHPRAFHKALAALGVSARQSLYVGDSQFDDVQGAKGVGIRTVWVNRKGASLDPSLPAPDYKVSDLLELLDILGVPREVKSR